MEAVALFIFLAAYRVKVGRGMTVIIKKYMYQFLKFISLIDSSSILMAIMSISYPGLFRMGWEHGIQQLVSDQVNAR